MRLRLFKDVFEALKQEPRYEIGDDFVLELIVMNMPQENYERVFDTFMHWSRFGDLFEYDEDTEKISIAEGVMDKEAKG